MNTELYFEKKIFSTYYTITGEVTEIDENIFEAATWTDTIHFESDTIKYKEFELLEDAIKHVKNTIKNYNPTK